MPSLTRKLINARPYYYARWCQRVDGRPKIVRTLYLGSLDKIVQAVEMAQQPLPPREAEVAHFAEAVALYDQAAQLGLVELIDAQIPKRHQGLSVGQYLVLAAITIQEVLVIYSRQAGQHKPRTAVCLSHRDEEQQRLCEALALQRYETQ
jgi:hypothetical protein